ncbi:hypothetical protein FD754_002931 [Muntiacus muntjak]|uniref:Uncharacterized protein n=1 Tax=Muntiacus muntjak TaxID=9888 RepID=A0A5N3WDK5_MUNMU|nr:hypothetical protein FD754_002931 [Muntiacus muntjak]
MASSRSFSEEQFQEACAELQNPRLLGWNWQMESRGLTIYRKLNRSSHGSLTFKLQVSPENFQMLEAMWSYRCALELQQLGWRATLPWHHDFHLC